MFFAQDKQLEKNRQIERFHTIKDTYFQLSKYSIYSVFTSIGL